MIDIGGLMDLYINYFGHTFFIATMVIGSGALIMILSVIPWSFYGLFVDKKTKDKILTYIEMHQRELANVVLKQQKRKRVNNLN